MTEGRQTSHKRMWGGSKGNPLVLFIHYRFIQNAMPSGVKVGRVNVLIWFMLVQTILIRYGDYS